MKELLIIRHAKSSWEHSALTDFQRPLNERGKKDAPEMAQRIKDKNVQPDLLLTSDANRALTTCMYFAKAFPQAAIIAEPKLYQALPKTIYDVIENIDNKFHSVAVFSHNTGITDFVNELTNVRIDNVPTCGIYALKIDTNNWRNFAKASKAFWFFDYPKNLIK